MKTLLISLTVASVMLVGSVASAAVVVHAGPVHVGVGVGRRPIHPVHVHRPVLARPVVRPVVVPVVPPAVAPVPAPHPVVGVSARIVRARRILNAIQEEVEEEVQEALESSEQ
jgi:hypothetical protein